MLFDDPIDIELVPAPDHSDSGEQIWTPLPRTIPPIMADAIWAPISGKGGLTYTSLQNPKLCLHTTETKGLPNYSSPPHITVDITGSSSSGFGTIWQHVDFGKGAYALRSPGAPNSPNMNAGPVTQVEMLGYAKDAADWDDDAYALLGLLVASAVEHQGVALVGPPGGFIGDEGYGTSSPSRMSWSEFVNFSGIHAHQHVPDNSHWDAGDIDEQRLIDATMLWLEGESEPEQEPEEPSTMYPLKLGMVSSDVMYLNQLLAFLGEDVDPQSMTYDERTQAGVVSQLPNTSGKTVNGRQGMMLLKRYIKD